MQHVSPPGPLGLSDLQAWFLHQLPEFRKGIGHALGSDHNRPDASDIYADATARAWSAAIHWNDSGRLNRWHPWYRGFYCCLTARKACVWGHGRKHGRPGRGHQDARGRRVGRRSERGPEPTEVDVRDALYPPRGDELPEAAALAMHFDAWLDTLPTRERRFVRLLASAWRTEDAAKAIGLSAVQATRIKRQLLASWVRFNDTTS